MPKMEIMCRKTLQLRIDMQYKQIVDETVAKLKSLSYLCLTADCWSSHARAFLGVTCHWINQDFSRESVVLACTRFKGTHSFDRIAEQLNVIMDKYSIRKEQVVAIVTDNGSNFCKAFKEYGIEFEHAREDTEKDMGTENLDFLEDTEEDEGMDNELLEIDLHAVLETKKLYLLPPHVRCTSHSLSLVATKDGLEVCIKLLKIEKNLSAFVLKFDTNKQVDLIDFRSRINDFTMLQWENVQSCSTCQILQNQPRR